MSKGLSALSIIRLIFAVVLIFLGLSILLWAYNTELDFGGSNFALANKYFIILFPTLLMSFGFTLYSWKVKSDLAYPRSVVFIISFIGILAGIFGTTIAIGLPFDASFEFGVNAQMIATAINIVLPAITIILAIITIWITKDPQAIWFVLMKVGILIGLMIVYALVIYPNWVSII